MCDAAALLSMFGLKNLRTIIEEHEGELKAYKAYVEGFYSIDGSESKPVMMWAYLGKRSDSVLVYNDIDEYVSDSYTDPSGLVWGSIRYFANDHYVWVCLSDPYSEDPAHDNADAHTTAESRAPVDLKADPTPADEIPMSNGNEKVLKIVGLPVGGMVLVTAGLLIGIFFGCRKSAGRIDEPPAHDDQSPR